MTFFLFLSIQWTSVGSKVVLSLYRQKLLKHSSFADEKVMQWNDLRVSKLIFGWTISLSQHFSWKIQKSGPSAELQALLHPIIGQTWPKYPRRWFKNGTKLQKKQITWGCGGNVNLMFSHTSANHSSFRHIYNSPDLCTQQLFPSPHHPPNPFIHSVLFWLFGGIHLDTFWFNNQY